MKSFSKNATSRLVQVLGEIIKTHRTQQQKTIYRISAECSMHKDAWRLIEKGLVHDVKISSIWKIAEGLGIDPIALLSEVKDKLGDDFTISGLN
ncbi:MAG: helix-turn-helix domain-containing protein [Cyanobacteria bacterium RUI128]|nr:helix-turn-helix domain-containing protein [Cyanobacteria bacterium RUI128]